MTIQRDLTILLQPPTYILLELCIILISLIIYKPSTLIISPQTFSTQLGADTSLFCLSQCAIPFCTLSPSLLSLSLPSREVLQSFHKADTKEILKSLRQPFSSRATEGEMIEGRVFFLSVPQSILLGLQSNDTTKEKKQRKSSKFPKIVRVK